MNLSVDHIYVCLRLFYNKLKAAEALDDTVTTQLLNNLPILLKRHFNDEDETESKLDLSFIKKSSEKQNGFTPQNINKQEALEARNRKVAEQWARDMAGAI